MSPESTYRPEEARQPDEMLDAAWRRSPSVALRQETFGAMAYHYGTRRLSFLKSRRLADAVGQLERHATARAACAAAGVTPAELPTYARALRTLADTGMIVLRGDARTVPVASAGGEEGQASVEHAVSVSAPGPASGVASGPASLASRFESGLEAPICLTWELTYACNLACRHCLSSSGRRDPAELTTAECMAFVEELAALGVFYVNIGGGEPTIRSDFWELVEHAVDHRVGVKFSTNGTRISRAVAARLAGMDYVDVQISLDGATPSVNDHVRGDGTYAAAVNAMANLRDAGFDGFKLSVVVTRHNVTQLDDLEALAGHYGAQLRLTRLRPSGRGASVWDELHPTQAQQRVLYDWLKERDERVLTGDSFFHLAGYGEPLPGLNLCGAGRVVCLVDPVGDVYACPFTIHDDFRAGNVRRGGFTRIWRESPLLTGLRRPADGGSCSSCGAFGACRGGCMAAKFFTGMPIDGPDPECVRGHGADDIGASVTPRPRPAPDHSRRPRSAPGPVRTAVPVRFSTVGRRG